MSHLTYAEAGIVGLIQGVTELFPISSLGHASSSRRSSAGSGPRT